MADNIHGASTQATASAAPKLEVTRGENIGEIFKVSFETSIGRELDNNVVLLDARASRYHAKIFLDNGQWQVIDLNSANGTQVNGVTVSGPVTLKTGDRVTLGETELLFRFPGTAEAGPAFAPTAATPAATPVPIAPPAGAITKKRPRLAWIAGGVILFVCFAAVFVLYIASSRFAGEESVAAGGDAPASDSGAAQDSSPQTDVPEASSFAPEDLTLVYEDDFSDSFGGWDDAFDQYTRKVYGNNRYQIEVQASNLVAWGLANRDVADFELEVEAKLEDGDQKNSYGVLFRFQDRENFYRFDISGDGYYLFSKFIDGEWSTLIDWTQSQFINTGGAPNILKVSAFGPNIALWANGQQLATLSDDALAHGNFGFFAGTFAEPYAWVSYDNLKLWSPASTELTLIPTATRSGAAIVVVDAAVSPTPLPPTSTPTPEPVSEESESPVATPAVEAALAATEEPTTTPVPLPEYASRDQTLA
ncbi:MAG TPA: FHA domain-containing protein, partial [Anaerolineae bacterium]|nr:FHA domain-containing protein [Anaerolineae bacterium]